VGHIIEICVCVCGGGVKIVFHRVTSQGVLSSYFSIRYRGARGICLNSCDYYVEKQRLCPLFLVVLDVRIETVDTNVTGPAVLCTSVYPEVSGLATWSENCK
jgi:hypothetical protein